MAQTGLYGKPMQQIYSCVNGRFMRAARAALPVADRGFRFGDGVFETIRLEADMPYQWPLHMARMAAGLAALRIPMPEIDWAAYVRHMIRKNKANDGFLRIAVSRGSGSRGYLPHPAHMPASWVMEYLPPLEIPTEPFQLWLSQIARTPLQALPVNYKLAQGVGSTLALLEANDHACQEALQLSSTGLLCETASANLFWLKDDVLYTPSLDCGCLSGTTRDAVLRLSTLPTHTVQAGLGILQHAQAVFISNARLGIWPIQRLQPMGWTFNARHPFIKKMSDLLARDRVRETQAQKTLWSRPA